MPIYEFECRACGTRFDRLQKLSDPDPDTCPQCGAHAQVSRRLTAPAFRLSGSGWYETDFKKDGDKKRNLVSADEGAKPSGESAKKDATDKPASAPAPAAEAKTSAPVTKPASGPPPVNSG